MKVLEETPDRLVVQGTTVVAEMGRACAVMALIPVGVIALMGLTALARWAVDRGDLSAGVVVAAPAAGVGLLALWLLWPKRAAPPRRSPPTPGARIATFDAVAGVVDITGVGTFPLGRVRGASLENAEDAGDNVAICFYDREAVSLSHVTIGDRQRVQHVVDAIQAFLARPPPRAIEPPPAPVPLPPRPSVQEAQSKEEFEQALAAMRDEVEAARRRVPRSTR